MGTSCPPSASSSLASAAEGPRVAEARYRALFDAIDEGFCVIRVIFDATNTPCDYVFLEANPAFERQTGLTRVVGRSMRELAPSHEQYWFEIYGRIALTGESARFESHAAALGGRWFNVFAFRVDAPEARHVAILFYDITEQRRHLDCVVEEITERKRVENALRESEAQLRRLIDNIAGFVAMLDREGTLLEIGEPALLVAGVTREQVIGCKFWECGWWLHDPQQQQWIREWFFDAAKGATVRHDVVARTADDGRLAIDLMLAPVFDAAGQVTHVIPSGIDISARKRMEIELRENEARLNLAAKALREADRRKDEFLATLAHELRNPLAPIRSGVHILRVIAGRDPRVERMTEMMDRQVTHLVRLVDDLLDVSRITRGKVELRREPVVLNQVLGSARESVQALFEAKEQALVVSIPSAPLCVEGDSDRITQVFANLLSNAAKFTPHAGTVWLTLEHAGEEAVVTVRDTGIGISADDLHEVFEMFSQVHAARGNDGLGIGLALVKQLVHMHRGTVTAESEGPGRGSRFVVRLPVLRSEAVPHFPISHQRPVRAGSESPSAPAPKRVLVVDDNVDAAQALQQLLSLQGHLVRTCASGREAVEAAGPFAPDVIFMDIGMADIDGLTATRLIRAQPFGAGVRIVALTGWGQETDRRMTREAGIDEHLVKPVSVEDVLSLLRDPPQ